MNVGDIQTRVFRSFGDVANVQITSEDLIRWINDGQKEIALKSESVLPTSATVSSITGDNTYTLPSNLLVLRSVQYKGIGEQSFYHLEYLNRQEFDQYISGWNGTSYGNATPTVYTVESGELLLFPSPNSNGVSNIKLYYCKIPSDVTTVLDTPEVPLIYHTALVYYCLQQAYILEQDWTAAGNAAQAFQGELTKLHGRESNVANNWEAYPTITVCWEDEY